MGNHRHAEDMKHNPKTVGKPVPGTEVEIFSKQGERLPEGEVGELFIKSNMLFEGYTSANQGEREGYTSIGDLGRIDDDGYLFRGSRRRHGRHRW